MTRLSEPRSMEEITEGTENNDTRLYPLMNLQNKSETGNMFVHKIWTQYLTV
jgi:hypothetical protein